MYFLEGEVGAVLKINLRGGHCNLPKIFLKPAPKPINRQVSLRKRSNPQETCVTYGFPILDVGKTIITDVEIQSNIYNTENE